MQDQMPTPAALVARGVSRRHGDVQALAGLTASVAAGEVVALLGPNGAGKSTFVDLVLGRGRPDSGSLRVLGQLPGSLPARAGTGAMLQRAMLAPQLTVEEHLTLHRGYYEDPLPLQVALERTGLQPWRAQRFGRLSLGQQRRVQFALAVCGRPRLLVLDEPTAALDAESRQLLWAAVRQCAADGAAVLLTTHLLDDVEALATRVLLINAGRLVEDGSVAAVRARVGGRAIRCVTTLDDAALAALPGVLEVRHAGRQRLLRTATAEATLRALLLADTAVSELDLLGPSLEDALTDALRREAA